MSASIDASQSDHKALIILLRIVGVASCLAIVATLMPTSWIVAANDWAGLGTFPDAPVTQYLARTISFLYAVFGALTILVSTDVRRYVSIILFLAYVTVVFGVLLLFLDPLIGMPSDWSLFEGPTTMVLGIAVFVLARHVRRDGGETPSARVGIQATTKSAPERR